MILTAEFYPTKEWEEGSIKSYFNSLRMPARAARVSRNVRVTLPVLSLSIPRSDRLTRTSSISARWRAAGVFRGMNSILTSCPNTTMSPATAWA